MKKVIFIIVLLLVISSIATPETIRLKSGKYITGKIFIDESDNEGFKIQPWDLTGVLYIRWAQLTELEKARIQNILNPSSKEAPKEQYIDGVLIVTRARTLEGIIIKEDKNDLILKTVTGEHKIPINGILSRTPIKLRPNELYNPQELLEIRARQLNENNPDKLIELANYAKSLRLYREAKDYLSKAKTKIPPAREGEVSEMIAKLDKEIMEMDATALLEEVNKLLKSNEFDEAYELAEKLLKDFPDSEVAKANNNLPQKVKAEEEEYKKNRDKILAQKVPERWYRILDGLLVKAAKEEKMSSASRYVEGKADGEIVQALSKEFNITKDEIEKYWGMRDSKKKIVASFGLGSWIALGGSEGMDYQPSGRRQPLGVDPKTGQFLYQNEPQGKRLQTRDEWWQSSNSTTRKEWLKAYYAGNSQYIKVVEQKKVKCSYCKGEGKVDETREGQNISVICPRCHGVKDDLTIIFY